MGVLLSIDRCLNTLPKDLLAEDVIYIELDREKYEALKSEITTYANMTEVKFGEERVEDFGKCSVFGYNGYKIIVALSKDSRKTDTFYVAFRTKVI